MSDTTEHTTQGGVDWELRSAEDGMIAAQDRKALAQAMRRHSDGVRNMMQSELVPSFENAIDGIMARHVGSLSSEIGGLRAALQAEFRTGLSGVQRTVSALAKSLESVSARVSVVEKRLDVSESRLARLESVNDRLSRIEQILAERPTERDQERGAIADEVVQRLEAAQRDGE